jgi:hypothetical protein
MVEVGKIKYEMKGIEKRKRGGRRWKDRSRQGSSATNNKRIYLCSLSGYIDTVRPL